MRAPHAGPGQREHDDGPAASARGGAQGAGRSSPRAADAAHLAGVGAVLGLRARRRQAALRGADGGGEVRRRRHGALLQIAAASFLFFQP